ncbi:hypothetical protein MKW94_003778 [Papaver nudicaule]|uniref:Nucleotide-diphospho-sugar transferase domain-containing protein n=1 Tax=Papaver nudicaule TaxID=74823 RepID=A0AA41S6W8_PAPNU|nr:hypothetical protein [Papaver nudicaule]
MGKVTEVAMVPDSVNILRRVLTLAMLIALVAVPCVIFYIDEYPLQFLRLSSPHDPSDSAPLNIEQLKLDRVLKGASTKDKTVILTTVNEAWAAPNSILDLFLESFKIGEDTKHLLNHLVISCLGQKAYERCLEIHPYCYALKADGVDFSKEAYFGSPDYVKVVWSKIDYQKSVLELGYNFVFTDADIMWFRDPFIRFYEDTDFQVSSDRYGLNNSYDLKNNPNSGFEYVKSNNRTIQFYNLWYNSRLRYTNSNDQSVLSVIKNDPFIREIRLTIRFLDTLYFGGFCEPSKDFNKVCTMHANCCFGAESKLHDLGLLLDDWRNYTTSSPSDKRAWNGKWRGAQECR